MQSTIQRFLVASCLAASSILPACGGGGGGSGGADPTLTFAITDTASDDVESFTVEVTQVRLRKLGGAIVDVLTTPATVDLATLTESSQILSVGNVPAGTYVEAEITLDFTNSVCNLVGQSAPATILDVAGNPLTGTLVLPMDFGTNRLIAPFNRHKLLEFDFDLNQSVTADLGSNAVTVEPSFAMHVDPAVPKPLLAVGTLVSADTAMSTFVAEIRTFSGTLLTTATFQSDASTVWHVDGVSSTGAPGLAALAAEPAGTWVQLVATIHPNQTAFDVLYVEAGVGTWNGGTDIVEGHIVDRTGAAGTDPILTVVGSSSDAAHTTFQLNATFTVSTTFASTKVLRTAIDQAFDSDDLNVGQRVRIFGALTGLTMDATSATSVVKMLPTRVLGFATSAPGSGVLTIDLERVDQRLESAFNWPAGGPTPPDPNAFDVQVGGLDAGLGIVNGTPVEARGFFPAIDDAAEDFVASSLTNRALAPSLLFVRNLPGGMTVSLVPSPAAIEIDIAGAPGAGEFAVIDAGFVGTQNLPAAPPPTITSPPTGFHLYVLRDKGTDSTTLYVDFAAFSDAVADVLGHGANIDQVGAIGIYTTLTNQISAPIASIIVD